MPSIIRLPLSVKGELKTHNEPHFQGIYTDHPNTERSQLQEVRMTKAKIVKWGCISLVTVFVILIVGVIAFSGSLTGSAPAPLQLPQISSAAENVNVSPPDGRWVTEKGSLAGFRVGESFFLQSGTIVGRTSAVTGTLVISNNEVSSGSFQVDLSKITFGGKQNDNFFKLLETGRYPSATITLTKPIVFQSIPNPRQTISFKAPAILAVHGITHKVTFTILARYSYNGSVLEAVGSAPILASDWNVKSPYAVHNNALIEFLVDLHRG
jgi:polyisoprenoid-binding protein YceI